MSCPSRKVPDVIGLVGRREGAAESCVLQGRDIHFHDVTIVNMGEVPDSSVSIPDLSALSQQ